LKHLSPETGESQHAFSIFGGEGGGGLADRIESALNAAQKKNRKGG
jgi:hypothetical protein